MFENKWLKTFIFALVALTLAALPVVKIAHASSNTPDWSAVQANVFEIQNQAVAMQQEATQLRQNAEFIRDTETDPEVVQLASQIVDLATQMEQDAGGIIATTGAINSRIDNSEGTTLQLSQDIGVMADRIGVMADRILLTEAQIGIMADRIVMSEALISDSSLGLAQQMSSPLH